MGGAKLFGEGSGGRLRPKGGAHAPVAPPGYGLAINTTRLYLLYQ